MLFDSNVERSEGSALASESKYDYLRRSNRPQAIEIYHWMNEWFRDLPPRRDATNEIQVNGPERRHVQRRSIRIACSPDVEEAWSYRRNRKRTTKY